MRRTERAAGLVALVLGLLHWWLDPTSGTDYAAQATRASFAHDHPFAPLDLSWYGGMHPWSYSLLSPSVMAILGVQLSGLVAAVVGAVLLARLVRDSERPRLAALSGAVFLAANLVSGRTTFALGAAAAFAALVSLPRRRWAALFALLCGLFSPVAAAFLGLCAAVLVLHRRPGGWPLGLAASIPVIALSQGFPQGGVQPFGHASARPAIIAAVVVALLAHPHHPLVRTGAILYGLGVVGFLAHEDPFGSNVLRLGLLMAVTVVLAAVRRRGAAVLLASTYLVFWQIGPPFGDIRASQDPPMLALSQELERLGAQRVEVVAPRNHSEAHEIAEHVNLVRGWSRQLDRDRNPLFYDGTLDSATFSGWLQLNAVDHVALQRKGRRDWAAPEEAELLRSGGLGLQQVWENEWWTVWRVPWAFPLVDAPVAVIEAGRAAWRLASDGPADVAVRLRWSPWLSLEGPGCIERQGDGVLLRTSGPGVITLSSSVRRHGHC
jgi:hypothetical protein